MRLEPLHHRLDARASLRPVGDDFDGDLSPGRCVRADAATVFICLLVRDPGFRSPCEAMTGGFPGLLSLPMVTPFLG